jgi:seryl-tRNA synthetase
MEGRMPDADDKKKMEDAKKQIHAEVKKLGAKCKKQTEEAKKLVEEGKDKKIDPKRAKEIDVKLKDLNKDVQSEADKVAANIAKMLKTMPPPKDVPTWQKGMAPWYVDILNKEPGLDIGGGARVNGSISIKDKKAEISFTWKLP